MARKPTTQFIRKLGQSLFNRLNTDSSLLPSSEIANSPIQLVTDLENQYGVPFTFTGEQETEEPETKFTISFPDENVPLDGGLPRAPRFIRYNTLSYRIYNGEATANKFYFHINMRRGNAVIPEKSVWRSPRTDIPATTEMSGYYQLGFALPVKNINDLDEYQIYTPPYEEKFWWQSIKQQIEVINHSETELSIEVALVGEFIF